MIGSPVKQSISKTSSALLGCLNVISILEEVWKKDDLKFGYIYNNDPHETINTQREVYCLLDCLRDKKIYYDDINFDIIPKRYNHLVIEYNKLLNKEK